MMRVHLTNVNASTTELFLGLAGSVVCVCPCRVGFALARPPVHAELSDACRYHHELPLGGYVADDIYYLGHAGVVQFGGLRIAGVGVRTTPQHSRAA